MSSFTYRHRQGGQGQLMTGMVYRTRIGLLLRSLKQLWEMCEIDYIIAK